MSTNAPRRRAALALLLTVMLTLLAACGDDGSTPASSQTITISVENGEPVGGVLREDVAIGTTVEIRVEGDLDEEVHIHGYDLHIEPGEDSVVFDAEIPGRFEVEGESSGRLLLELTVS